MDTRYRIEVEFDDESLLWIARCPQLRGCIGRGYNPVEALDALEHSQDDYLGRFADAQRWGEKSG